METTNIDPETVREKVRTGYSQIAQQGSERRGGGRSCCGSSPAEAGRLAQHVGYSAEELAALPDGANLGLACGNPNALAALKPGEVVLDLGSGGGFDVFIAGRKVAPSGRAIGVDMTPDMLVKARRNLEAYRQQSGLDNVEFRLGEIEHLPVADASVDAVISNCVINLSPDKPQVWREIARVLKPGGRVAVSDLALLQPLPPAVEQMVEALVGCVAGAVLVPETERMAQEAGLVDVVLRPKPSYVDGMVDWQDPLYQKIMAHLPTGAQPSEYVTSLEVAARKRSVICSCAETTPSHYSPAVAELVALGAAIAANCEPCFKYHYDKARTLGVSPEDMSAAVNTAQSVKQAPAQAILKLTDRFLRGDFAPKAESDCCPGSTGSANPPGDCCR
jgi:arsenite methyltransferase